MARHDVSIDLEGYILDPEYGDKAFSEDPQDPFVGASPDSFWQSWAMRSFHGGERQDVMLSSKDIEGNQYDEGEGLRLEKFGKATLQPALVRSLPVSSAHMPMVVTTDGARVIVGLGVTPYIKIWYNGSWSTGTGITGQVTDLLAMGSTIYAVVGGGIYVSTNNGSTWAQLQYTPRVVESISVTSGGSGYASAPTVVIEGDSGSGAAATAVLTDGKVTSINVTSAGTGYDDTPTIRFEGGGGTGAGAIAITGLGSASNYSSASALGTVNQKLYVGFTSGGVFNHTDSETVTTTGAVTSMCGYLEDLYWVEDCRLWRHNGKASFEFDKLPSGFNGVLVYPYRSVLFILGYYREQGGYRAACYYLWQGSENHLCSWGDFTADNRAYAMCGSDDEVWFAVPARGGGDRYDLTYGGLTSGPGWGEHGNIPYKAMAYCDGYFFCGRYDANESGTCQATGNDTTHTKLRSNASAVTDYYKDMSLTHYSGTGAGQTATITAYDGSTKIATHTAVAVPADSTTNYIVGDDGIYVANLANPTVYRTSGYLITSEFDFDFPNDEKILGSIALYFRPLEAGESIQAEYSLNGGDTWVVCGLAEDIATTRKVWTFPNLRFDTVKLRVTEYGPGTSTPTLKKVLVRACAVSQAKWMWKIHLIASRVASRGGRVRKGYKAVQALKDSHDKQLPVAFVDRIGRPHTVVIKECVVDQQAQSKRDAYLYVELLEL